MTPSMLSDPSTEPESARKLSSLLLQQKSRLMEQWRDLVLSDPHVPQAKGLSRAELLDELPLQIDCMATLLTEAAQPRRGKFDEAVLSNAGETARFHAAHRFR